MRSIFAIAKREVLSFFVSPIAYFVIAGFFLIGGFFFFQLLGLFNLYVEQFDAMPFGAGSQYEAPNLNQWVIEGFFHTLLVILVFLIPMLTMRLLADERRNGTFELLITSPVSVAEVVLGKMFGIAFVLLVMIGMAGLLPLFLVLIGAPDVPPILSGLLGVYLCALGFASIGMALSSFAENQVVAAVSAMVVLLLLYVIHTPAEGLSQSSPMLGEILMSLSPVMQVRDMLRGVISLKAAVYFISLIGLGVYLSQRALEAYRWR